MIAGGRIATFAFFFFFDTEFSETADQNILPGFKGAFHNFQQKFNRFPCLFSCKTGLRGNRFDDIGFGQIHIG